MLQRMRTSSMRLLFILVLASLCVHPALAQAQNSRPETAQSSATANPFPMQLEMRVPFEPTAFPSGAHVYVMYELHLTNFGSSPRTMSSIEVLDANATQKPAIALFQREELEAMSQPLGVQESSDTKQKLVIAPGQTTIVFMSVVFDRGETVPPNLLHRIHIANATAEGAVVTTHHTRLQVLGPPVQGADWLAADGPSNAEDNHHRRGVIILGGQVLDSRRYAIDWKKLNGDASSSGDPRDVHSYFSYGQVVLAVADARVTTARDGLPDNIPGHGNAFHSAVPITLDTVAGNTITLDLGDGQFAYYMHLQPGSISVKSGDHVHKGQVIARIGASGDAREPHLHFEVTTSSRVLYGEGLPYVIDRFYSKGTSGGPLELREHELPLDKTVIKFGKDNNR